jgi:tetratricopeptide (TPR) repeat protein
MRSRFLIPLSLILLASPPAMLAQVSAKEPPPPAAKKAEQTFDPYRAEKSVEIGRFYMKKGNYDAAIDRFEDAAHAKPNFALPYRLMGEAYEKKREKAQAVKSYEKYLEILPSAEDGGKVRKRIVQLKSEMERDAKRRK